MSNPHRKMIIGVMGPGEGATDLEKAQAYELGELIAQKGWILLTGGRNTGVMDSASQGAKSKGGLTLGILPDHNPENASKAVDIVIKTDLGNARNHLNVLSSDAVIACGMGLGTASEVALGLKNGKAVILLTNCSLNVQFFRQFNSEKLFSVKKPIEAIALVEQILGNDLEQTSK